MASARNLPNAYPPFIQWWSNLALSRGSTLLPHLKPPLQKSCSSSITLPTSPSYNASLKINKNSDPLKDLEWGSSQVILTTIKTRITVQPSRLVLSLKGLNESSPSKQITLRSARLGLLDTMLAKLTEVDSVSSITRQWEPATLWTILVWSGCAYSTGTCITGTERRRSFTTTLACCLSRSTAMTQGTSSRVSYAYELESGEAGKTGGKKAPGLNVNIAIETGKNSLKKEVSSITDSDYGYMMDEVVVPLLQEYNP